MKTALHYDWQKLVTLAQAINNKDFDLLEQVLDRLESEWKSEDDKAAWFELCAAIAETIGEHHGWDYSLMNEQHHIHRIED